MSAPGDNMAPEGGGEQFGPVRHTGIVGIDLLAFQFDMTVPPRAIRFLHDDGVTWEQAPVH